MSKYEFNKEEEKIFKSLSTYMTIFVILIGAGGVATIINFATSVLSPLTVGVILLLVEGILYCLMSVLFYFPIDNFKKIVKTQGRDIEELTKGLDEFQKGVLIINLVTLAVLILYVILALM